MDLALNNGIVFIDNKFQNCHLGIKDDLLVKISDQPIEATKALDCKNMHIVPGVIDSQVHFREPGLKQKEDIEHGSKAALLGGVSGFFEMPNTNPPTTNEQSLFDKLEIANKTSYVDYAFYAGATQENLNTLAELEKIKGCCGIKTFMGSSTGSLLLYHEESLKKVLELTKSNLAFHCEDEDRMIQRKEIANKEAHPRAHPIWRDEESAFLATKKIVELAKKQKRKVHILHITTKKEVDYLRENKDIASFEILPQHLYLNAPECYEELGSLAQMNPPIRDKSHQEALWQAVKNKWVDVIATDHAPHTLEEKQKNYPHSPSGLPGVESLVPLMLNAVNKGKISLEDFVHYLCIQPLKLFQITNRNPIEVNKDASFTIFDLNQKKKFKNHYKCGWSPFEDKELKGWACGLVLHGKLSMWKSELITGNARALAFPWNN